MFRDLVLHLCCFFVLAVAQAQSAANPFELLHRLPKSESASAASRNPFDVVPHRVPGASKVASTNKTEDFKPFAILPVGNSLPNGLLFGILSAIFAFLAFSVAANRNVIEKAWRGFLNESSLSAAQREASGIVGSTPYYLLYTNFVLSAGMFLFLVTKFFRAEKYNNLSFLAICVIGSGLFFLSKHVFLEIARVLYPVDAEARRYNFLIIIFNCVLGFFLLPFNFFIAFSSSTEYQGLLLFWMLGLISIFFLYRALRALSIGMKFLGFHFLLYLCVVEIAPLAFVLKMATLQR
jgi:preprotein translocase subunit SecE